MQLFGASSHIILCILVYYRDREEKEGREREREREGKKCWSVVSKCYSDKRFGNVFLSIQPTHILAQRQILPESSILY